MLMVFIFGSRAQQVIRAGRELASLSSGTWMVSRLCARRLNSSVRLLSYDEWEVNMTVILNRLTLLCLAVLLSAVQSLAQQEDVSKKFAGTYVTGHEFGGGALTLDADGRFSVGGGSDDGTQISTSGTYTLSNGRLRFIIVKNTGKRGGEGKEFNLLDPQDRKEMFGDSGRGRLRKNLKWCR